MHKLYIVLYLYFRSHEVILFSSIYNADVTTKEKTLNTEEDGFISRAMYVCNNYDYIYWRSIESYNPTSL